MINLERLDVQGITKNQHESQKQNQDPHKRQLNMAIASILAGTLSFCRSLYPLKQATHFAPINPSNIGDKPKSL
jgi:hypothetical protein